MSHHSDSSPRITLICPCGKEYSVDHPYEARRRKFCSIKCGASFQYHPKERLDLRKWKNVTHLNGKPNPLHSVWRGMISRCSKPGRRESRWYFDRGITVCSEWQDWDVFHDWALANGWKHGLQIDRTDTNGNYEPSNCRFVTCEVNQQNRRDVKPVRVTLSDNTCRTFADARLAAEFIGAHPASVFNWLIGKHQGRLLKRKGISVSYV